MPEKNTNDINDGDQIINPMYLQPSKETKLARIRHVTYRVAGVVLALALIALAMWFLTADVGQQITEFFSNGEEH